MNELIKQSKKIKFQAVLQRDKVAINEELLLTIRVTNQTANNIDINDPFSVKESIKIKVALGDDVQWIILGGPLEEDPHGVPYIPRTLSVAKRPFDIFFKLHEHFVLNKPGSYTLAIVYTWQGEETWYSPDYQFHVLPTACESVDVVPHESSANGMHDLFWLENQGDIARVLLKPIRIQDKKIKLSGATSVGVMPSNSDVTLSTQPFGDPLPDRWMIGLKHDDLYVSYLSDEDDLKLAAFGVKLPQSMTLVKPALAGFAPDEERPSCSIGLITSKQNKSAFNLLNVSPQGEFKASSPVLLPGIVEASWALTTESGERVFLFAVQNEQTSQLFRIYYRHNQPAEPAELITDFNGKYSLGDMRLMDSGLLKFSVLVNASDCWIRHVFQGPAIGKLEPSVQQQIEKPHTPCKANLLKIDSSGQVHLLFNSENKLYYVSPESNQGVLIDDPAIAQSAFYKIFVLASAKVNLIYHHNTHGLSVKTL